MGDYYDRYWKTRDYPSEEDRPRRKRRPRFDKYRVTGMMLLFFGIAILALGIFDIGWTTSRYGNNCQPDSNPLTPFPNLCTGNHVYVYVGSPLWGGALLICVAFLSLSVHPDKAHHQKAHRQFLMLLGFNMVIILPAIIVLNVLEVFFGKNIFWMYASDGAITFYDTLQFGLPIAIIILAGMALNVILFFSVFMYCCSDDAARYHKRHRYQDRGHDGPGQEEESYRDRRYSPRDNYRYNNRGGYSGYGGASGYGGGRRNYYN